MQKTKAIYYSSFLEFYEKSIAPKLMEIDIFIKTCEGFISIPDVSKLLYISENEVNKIMLMKNIEYVDSSNFFHIMVEGSSYICQLFFREKACGSPYVYTRQEISYIYDLNIDTINNICTSLNITDITRYSLPLVFAQICAED